MFNMLEETEHRLYIILKFQIRKVLTVALII